MARSWRFRPTAAASRRSGEYLRAAGILLREISKNGFDGGVRVLANHAHAVDEIDGKVELLFFYETGHDHVDRLLPRIVYPANASTCFLIIPIASCRFTLTAADTTLIWTSWRFG